MAFDTYLDLDGITGEATAKGFEGKIELFSFSLGASNPTTIGAGTEGSAGGRVSVSSFSLMKKTDKASPALFQACCKGKHFAKAKVTLRKAGGDAGQGDFLVYEFENVFIDSIQWSGSTGGDDSPMESLSLAFGKITVTYQPQDTKGGVSNAVVGSWDLQKVA